MGLELLALWLGLFIFGEFPYLIGPAVAFPFEQIGRVLGWLSGLGALGRGAALALWGALSLLPLLFLTGLGRGPATLVEKVLLSITSLMLFIALWKLAGPMEAPFGLPGAELGWASFIKAVWGGVIWSLLILFGVLRLLELFRGGDKERLLIYQRRMLWLLCCFFTGLAALSAFEPVSAWAEAETGTARLALCLGYVSSALPYGLDAAVTVRAMKLLDSLLAGQRAEAAKRARRLSALCCVSLGISAALPVLLNLFQLALAKELSSLSFRVELPFLSLVFVLAVLLLTRLIEENRQLRDDNELFI